MVRKVVPYQHAKDQVVQKGGDGRGAHGPQPKPLTLGNPAEKPEDKYVRTLADQIGRKTGYQYRWCRNKDRVKALLDARAFRGRRKTQTNNHKHRKSQIAQESGHDRLQGRRLSIVLIDDIVANQDHAEHAGPQGYGPIIEGKLGQFQHQDIGGYDPNGHKQIEAQQPLQSHQGKDQHGAQGHLNGQQNLGRYVL